MENINERLKKMFDVSPVKDKEKLKNQQDYYKRLEESGIAKKQSYNLKSISSI